MERKLSEARKIAIKKGIIKSGEELQISQAKNKRFVIIKDGKRINFGVWPFSGSGTFIDHNDNKIRDAWRARHSKILLKDGTPAYMSKDSPDYYAWRILW
jgi:hypothetical protein